MMMILVAALVFLRSIFRWERVVLLLVGKGVLGAFGLEKVAKTSR